MYDIPLYYGKAPCPPRYIIFSPLYHIHDLNQRSLLGGFEFGSDQESWFYTDHIHVLCDVIRSIAIAKKTRKDLLAPFYAISSKTNIRLHFFERT